METMFLFCAFFLGIFLTLAGVILSIRKSYNFYCLKIRKELESGKRKWYLVSIFNRLVFSILPLKDPNSIEFGELDEEKSLIDTATLFALLNDPKERISNKHFVNDIMLKTEMSIQKIEPATK